MAGVLVPTRTEADWLAARQAGITASEIAIVMGLSPYSSPYALYHQKAGTLPREPENDVMRLGTYMEEWVAAEFNRRHSAIHATGNGRTLYAHPERPWQMATPDRVVCELTDTAGCTCGATEMPGYGHARYCGLEVGHVLAVLECKIDGGSDEWGEDGSDQIPVHYRCQVLWQMDVMGVSTAFVACLVWHRRKVAVYEISLDDAARADLELMRAEAETFLLRLERGIEPEIDWRPATTAALRTLHPSVEDTSAWIPAGLAKRYRAACSAYKAAGQRKKQAENEIRARIGPARRAITRDGQPVARRDVYDVREHVRKGSHVDKLVNTPPKEPTP